MVLKVNGVPVGEGQWTGLNGYELTAEFDQSILWSGTNEVVAEALLESGVPYSLVYVDGVDVSYDRYYYQQGGEVKAK